MSQQDLPLKGFVVRTCGSAAFWKGSATLSAFRKLGGRVVCGMDAKITHLVTIHAPIAPFHPNDGTMFGEEFSDYVKARSFVDALPTPASVLGLADFKDMVLEARQAHEGRAQAREGQRKAMMLAPLKEAAPAGYVGL